MRITMKRPLVLSFIGVLFLAAAVLLALFSYEGSKTDSSSEQAPPATEAQNTPRETPSQQRPSFDIVRIDPNGNTVIAGLATPNTTITILDNGSEIGSVKADLRGEWVYLPKTSLPPGTHELSLRSQNNSDSFIDSEDIVTLVVPEHGGIPLAVKSDRSGKNSRVLQGTSDPVAAGNLTIDSIDYDANGTLHISGKAEKNGHVHLYLDNQSLGSTLSDENGFWSLSPTERASSGKHVVRSDLIDETGTVRARVELPFERVEIQDMPQDTPTTTHIVIQPGNSLWLIARKAYGTGMAYTVIYNANKSQIRDPDLVYPGQVLILPNTLEPH